MTSTYSTTAGKLQTATRRLYDLLLTPDVEIVPPQDVDMDTFAVLADYFFEAAQRRHRSAQVSHVPYSKGLEIGSGRVTKIRAKHHADTGSNIVAGRQESGANRQPLLFMPTDLPTDITKAAMKLSNHQADHRIKRWLLDSWNALFPAREKQRTQIHPSDIARVVVHGWPEDFPPFGKPLSKVATGDLRILVAITDAGYFTMEMVLETDDDEMTLSAESGEEGATTRSRERTGAPATTYCLAYSPRHSVHFCSPLLPRYVPSLAQKPFLTPTPFFRYCSVVSSSVLLVERLNQ